MSEKRSAWKRWLMRLGIALIVIAATLVLINGIVNWRAGKVIRAEVEAVRALREPLNWDELARADRNGRVVESGGPSADSEISRAYAQAIKAAKAWGEGDGVDLYAAIKNAEKPVAEDAAALAKSLEGFQEGLEFFRQGAKLQGLVVNVETASDDWEECLAYLPLMRTSARMLAARACVAAAQGRGDEAADWCIVLCWFAGAMPADNLIFGLVNIAVQRVSCQTVASCREWTPGSPAKARELMSALAELETDTPLARAFCGERLFGLSIFHGEKYVGDSPKFFKRPNEAEYMKVMRQVIALARKPFPASLDEMDTLVRRCAGKSGFFAVMNTLTPALSRALTESARMQAELRVLRVSLALRCARAEGKGLPESLNTLVPKYIEKIPLDPFTGKPLLYKRTDSGYLIYSTGSDRTDNGGTEFDANKQKYKPGTDIVVEIKNRKQ